MELPVIGTLAPKREYEGQDASVWPYWEVFFLDSGEKELVNKIPSETTDLNDPWTEWTPVTKPYYYGWINGVIVQLPDGNTTSVTSGLTDADREWLATDQAKIEIESGNLFAAVKAMSFNDKGRLRHPYLVKLRNAEDGMEGEEINHDNR